MITKIPYFLLSNQLDREQLDTDELAQVNCTYIKLNKGTNLAINIFNTCAIRKQGRSTSYNHTDFRVS